MQNSLVGLLSSYDIFGKSIPGAVFFLSVISLLPAPTTETAQNGFDFLGVISPRSLVTVLAFALLLGLIFGEAIHTLAVNSERFVAWLGTLALAAGKFVRNTFPELHELTIARPDYANISETESQLYDRLEQIRRWVERRYYGIVNAFIGHRRLFALKCVSNYNDKPGLRRAGEPKQIFKRFEDKFNKRFDRDLPKEGIPELMETYPLVTSVVSKTGGQQFRRFQSVYSFCRSMWVTLLLAFIAHSLIMIDAVPHPSGTTVIMQILRDYSIDIVWLPVGLGIGVILFVDAAGTYKRHFVEYLVAEFALYTPTEDDAGGSEQ